MSDQPTSAPLPDVAAMPLTPVHWDASEVPAPAPVTAAQPDVPVPPGGKLLTLPSGFRVAIRSPKSLRGKDRKAIFAAADFGNENKALLGMELLAAIESTIITAWDVRDLDDATGEPVGEVLPIPSSFQTNGAAVLDLLSLEDLAPLDAEAREVQRLINPNFQPDPDESSPTPPSVG